MTGTGYTALDSDIYSLKINIPRRKDNKQILEAWKIMITFLLKKTDRRNFIHIQIYKYISHTSINFWKFV